MPKSQPHIKGLSHIFYKQFFLISNFYFLKEYLDGASHEDLVNIIIETNNQGNGSLDYIKYIYMAVSMSTGPPVEENNVSSPWCVCKRCVDMPTLEENKCCGRKLCVTAYLKLKKYCLDKDLLVLNIKAKADIRAEEWNFETKELRKAAYRQFTLWKYGRFGRGNRRVIPACVVKTVRQHFPSQDNTYMGYKKR